MVTRPLPPWEEGHFVGGHLVLDLTNTVFSRAQPVVGDELLRTASDVLSWCASAGLIDVPPPVGDADGRTLVSRVRSVREDAWAVFDAVAGGRPVPEARVGALMRRAGAGLRAGRLRGLGADLEVVADERGAAEAVPAALSLRAVHALFTLPAERVRACGRCGWLFLDSSRSGRRRWCSMSTCGNREKASRHRQAVRAPG